MEFLLAHQGGWDEILLVLVPLAVFAGLLVIANRRAERMAGEGDETTERKTTERKTTETDTADAT